MPLFSWRRLKVGALDLSACRMLGMLMAAGLATFSPSVGRTETVELFRDTAFSGGFGAAWIYGTKFSVNSGLREGRCLAYREIAPHRILRIPGGALNGINEPAWDFEEGAHHDFLDARGRTVDELHEHRLAVNHRVEENSRRRLQFAQFNNDDFPERDSRRDSRLVKRVVSNQKGMIRLYYNSSNEIRNVAVNYVPQFARDTWPHLLLVQRFEGQPSLADYDRIDFTLDFKVLRQARLSEWPAGLPGAAAPDMNLQCFFFLRRRSNPSQVMFIGMLLRASNPSIYFVHTAPDQWGTLFYREPITLQGPPPAVGELRHVRRELKSLVQEALTASAAKFPDKKFAAGPDDYYLAFFNIGWEGIGHWESDCEISGLSLRGQRRLQPPAK